MQTQDNMTGQTDSMPGGVGNTLHFAEHVSGLWFHDKTCAAVREAIVSAYCSRERIRIFTGDTQTGVSWGDEFDVIGKIGRSSGPMHVPLLIANARSMGGGALLDHCIVAIRSTVSRAWLYRHPTFSPGVFAVVASDLAGYVAAVTHDGKLSARFKKTGQAERYVEFMRGERFAK